MTPCLTSWHPGPASAYVEVDAAQGILILISLFFRITFMLGSKMSAQVDKPGLQFWGQGKWVFAGTLMKLAKRVTFGKV
jgi:hypothetical protein